MRLSSSAHRFAVVALLGVFGVACGATSPSGPLAEAQQRLNDARRTWRSQSIASYSFVFARGCFCAPDDRQPVRIVVRNHRIESVVTVSTGAPRDASSFRTIDGLFDLIQEAISGDAALISAEYDSQRGFPGTIYIDFDERLADEEYSGEARDFVPIG